MVIKNALFTILFAVTLPVTAAAQSECDEVKEYVADATSVINLLGPYPGNDQLAEERIKTFSETMPDFAHRFNKMIRKKAHLEKKPSWTTCYQQASAGAGLNYSSWHQRIAALHSTSEFRSPEFKKGFGLHIDVNQGVANLGKKPELYSFSARALVTYTFTRNNQPSAGRARIMAGPSLFYMGADAEAFANIRGEYRLKDIGNEFTSLGNIKLIGEVNHDFDDAWIYGGGPAIEIYNFGVQILYLRQNELIKSHLKLGVFYRFQF